MEILTILIPVSLLLGGLGLVGFVWAMKSRQFDDPAGDANRILLTDWDTRPRPPAPSDRASSDPTAAKDTAR